ncbi:MAG: hypothetical protein FWC56_05080, partial [Phycisphaerae bacterium]|nr:hypothetical protein [Phycisphaerae bacterium]
MAAALIAGILWLPGPLRAQSQPPTSSSPPQLSAPLSSSELTSPSSSESSNVPPPPPTPPTLQTDLPDLQADTNPSVTIPDATGTPDAMGTPNREPIAGRRIVKQFDFNEHSDYNNPWRPIRADGFPADLHGRLDTQVGHAAPPSFRFDLNGGSIAYQYEGNDIAVRPNSDYLVSGWVKTSNLKQARAYMTAFFMDRKGILIDNTELTSELVGSDEFNTDWHPIQIQMTGDVPMARYLGIVLWVAQPSVWDKRPRNLRDIPREDIQGTAWFDDLSVFRLPRVALRSSSPGNIFVNHEPVVLLPEVTDPDGLNLTATLTVKSVDGTWVDERSIIAQPE